MTYGAGDFMKHSKNGALHVVIKVARLMKELGIRL